MTYEYARIHLTFTIPLAGVLTVILRPLLTRLDLYKTLALIVIAFCATLPWDAYLIHRGIWTYPPAAIAGPRLLGVPAEELFFFVIQTYITALLYVLLNKPVPHAQFLAGRRDVSPGARRAKAAGQGFLAACVAAGIALVRRGDEGTYLGLILVWACPFALLTWTLSGYALVTLPPSCVAVPICAPTAYLWVVDELALRRGTWAIAPGTKLGWRVWGSLELEEAVFFLATNALVVFGLVAFDSGVAVLDTFPELFFVPGAPRTQMPSPTLLVRAVLIDPDKYDMARVRGLREAVDTLRRKSRSFYLASAVFSGRLRIDLVFLYHLCRVADDLVDESHNEAEARDWINKLTAYLDLAYASPGLSSPSGDDVADYVKRNFPAAKRSAFELLPTRLLPRQPLYELLEGFRTDLAFAAAMLNGLDVCYPIKTLEDLEMYAQRVAGTVGELCLCLVFHHYRHRWSTAAMQSDLVLAARTTGRALQYVNMARDIEADAAMGRVYIPMIWLAEEGLAPRDVAVVCANPSRRIERLRQRMLDLAFREYARARPAMDNLPPRVRAPLVVAVESYMEIGRVLRETGGSGYKGQGQRVTVSALAPGLRRLWVAWWCLWSQG
ncbi:hypothetical protein F4809DRAFT_656188 [Biscogniauxia mediterranea]|nr:hypothetical protein F4809DRAFT_656188 [Biscogniauxia mediterranea]